MTRRLPFVALLILAGSPAALAQSAPISRAEVLQIADSYVNHRWKASAENLRHGKVGSVEIHTPDREGGHGQPTEACWILTEENLGVPYKWGGWDSLVSFDAGIRAGKAAGDVYTPEKRRLGGAAVSGAAVGIDCSGFISRCWKLSQKHSTSMLFGICEKLPSASQLKPGDIMNTAEGHVLLLVKWKEDGKTGLFAEAAPFSKTLISEHDVADMEASGYKPLRYRKIQD